MWPPPHGDFVCKTCELETDLHGEEDDGGQADPAVQRVQIGHLRFGQVVRIEDGLEPDGSQ